MKTFKLSHRKTESFSSNSVMLILLFILIFTKSQAQPFDNRYGSLTTVNDGPVTEFVTCGAVAGANYTYAAVQSISYDKIFGPTSQCIRGVRINSNGTMFISTFDYIQEAAADYDIFPLKIITVNNNSEYLITGYVKPHSGIFAAPIRCFPFIIKADANLNATLFKIFDHDGFFTDVDELPNGDLLFSGSNSFLTTIASFYRQGWMLKTNATFTTQWMRFIYTNNSVASGKNFQIVHDAIVVDNDTAFVCGTMNEQFACNGGSVDSMKPRAFIAKVDLSTGAFVWQRNIFSDCFGARLALNSNQTLIAMATNGDLSGNNNIPPSLNYFDRGGNLMFRKGLIVDPKINVSFRINGYGTTSDIYTNPIIIQNIYFNSNDQDVFVSGKLMKVRVDENPGGNFRGNFDIPFQTVYNYSSGFSNNIDIFLTAQNFPSAPQNFLSYDAWLTNCNYRVYPPFYVASNTLPCLTGCSNQYVTVTADEQLYSGTYSQDKVWIYCDDNSMHNSVCGYTETSGDNYNLNAANHQAISNDDIVASPELDDFGYDNYDPDSFTFSCEQ